MGELYLNSMLIYILFPTQLFHMVAVFTAMDRTSEKKTFSNRMETGSRRDAGSTFAVVIVANSDTETSV